MDYYLLYFLFTGKMTLSFLRVDRSFIMKKVILKKLQSLTIIALLNAVLPAFSETDVSFDGTTPFVKGLTKEGEEVLNEREEGIEALSLKQLYLKNSYEHIQRHSTGPDKAASAPYQMALALVEEVYQDDYDDLLDEYEKKRDQFLNDPLKISEIKVNLEREVEWLKQLRQIKIEELKTQFSVV